MTEKPFVRNRFFAGKLLTAADLELEQNYFRGKLKLHNRSLHGFGIVSGLEVELSPKRDKLLVSSGLALDCEGNEIIVPEPLSYSMPQTTATSGFLTIQYHESDTNEVPVPGPEELCESSHILESFTLTFESQNPNQNHRPVRGRWQACGNAHSLVLAHLRKTTGQWRLDRRLRRPKVK